MDTQKTSETERKKLLQSSERRTALFLIGLIVMIAVACAATAEMSVDNFFMIANWRAFQRHGFYITDPLSMHHTFRCSLEKWLSCALVYGIYETAGLAGMRVMLFVLTVLIAFLQYRLCCYTSGNRDMSLVFTVFMIGTMTPFLQFRPQVFTIVILLLETLCLEHWIRERRVRYLIVLPLLSFLEMQFHSTIWPCFFMVFAAYLADTELVSGRPEFHFKDKLPMAAAAAACFGTLFCNPYGAWSVFYIFRSYGDADMNSCIMELARPTYMDVTMLIWLVLMVLALLFGNRKMPLRYLLLFIGFFAFSCTAVRNEIFLCALAGFVPCFLLREKKLHFGINLMLLLPLLLIVFCAGSEQSRGKEPDELETMTSLFDELKDHGIADGSDIYCDFNTGSYAEYFGFHPYIDGRAEVFLKKVNGEQDLFSEYVRHGNGEIYYRDFLDRYDFACLVVNSDMEPAFYQELLHAPEIEVLFTNREYTVFLEKRK